MYVNSLENKSGAAKPLNQTARISPGSESELGKINLKFSKREKCIINLMFDFIPSFFKLSLKQLSVHIFPNEIEPVNR